MDGQPGSSSWHGSKCVSETEWERQRISAIPLLQTDKHRKWTEWDDGIQMVSKHFAIFSYRSVHSHVSQPSFMVTLKIFGVVLLIHTWWAGLIDSTGNSGNASDTTFFHNIYFYLSSNTILLTNKEQLNYNNNYILKFYIKDLGSLATQNIIPYTLPSSFFKVRHQLF